MYFNLLVNGADLAQGYFQATGIAPPSFTSAFLERKDLSPEEEFDLKWSSASLYSGKPSPPLAMTLPHIASIVF